MKDNHSRSLNRNQSSLEEVVASAVLSHMTQVVVDSENSPSAAYLPAEKFLQGIVERLRENPRFIQQIADSVASQFPKTGHRKDFYTLREVAERLNKQPKPFSRVAEERYGLEKIYIGSELNFRADQVESLIAELKGESAFSSRGSKVA